jgi:hypothetical protein
VIERLVTLQRQEVIQDSEAREQAVELKGASKSQMEAL